MRMAQTGNCTSRAAQAPQDEAFEREAEAMSAKNRVALGAMALLIAACGGGGGGDTNPPPTGATVSLSGVAAKGLMAGADVGVYAVNADGTLAATALATTTTDKDGKYSLNFSGTQGQPYAVRVSAKADGSTTEADEFSGAAVSLPAGFAMRALVVPASTGAVTTSANVTPFSEMAVAAAAKAAGGITAANASQAMATVKQLIGFEPTATRTLSTSAAGATADEQRLAVLLTAVAQMAGSGAMGCAGASAGDKVKCVVDALAAAASTSTLKLSGAGGTDVSAALGTAINQVLTSNLAGSVNAATLSAVVANLGCTANCAVAGMTPAADPVATGIAAAKLLFSQMKADWTAMFSDDGVTSVSKGAANAQAFKFTQAMGEMQRPLNTMALDTKALYMGVDLYNAYKSGTSNATTVSDGTGNVPSNNAQAFRGLGSTGCGLYSDSNATVLATKPAEANVIGCSAYYYAVQTVIAGGLRNTFYRHATLVTPNPDRSFGWQMRARRTVNDCTPACVRTANDNLQHDSSGQERVFTGTLTPASTLGQITTWVQSGDLPAGFVTAGPSLADDRSSITLNVTRKLDAATHEMTDLAITAGTYVSKDTNGAALASFTVRKGHFGSLVVGVDNRGNFVAPDSPAKVGTSYTLGPFELDLVYATPGAAFEGVVSVSDPAWDKSKTSYIPTKESFVGTLTTIDAASGARTDFLTGTLGGSASGFATFDATQPLSPGNNYTQAVTFVGTVTAPGRPVLEVTLGGSAQTNAHVSYALPATLQYRSLANGQPRTVINFTASPAAAPSTDLTRFTFSEAASGLTAAWQKTDATTKLMAGNAEIGTVNLATNVITFKDGSVMSLDFGL